MFPILEESFQLFTIKYDSGCRVLTNALYQMECISFYCQVVELFFIVIIMKGSWIFVPCFTASIEMIISFFPLILLIYYINFHNSENILHIQNKLHLVRVCNSFCILIDLFVSILQRIFLSLFIRAIGLFFPFVLPLWYQCSGGLIEKVTSSFLIFFGSACRALVLIL